MPINESIKESPTLTIAIAQDQSRLNISFSGQIDEFAPLRKIWDKLETLRSEIQTVAFDLSGVNTLNSVGIRHWLLFLQKVEGAFAVEFSLIGERFVEMGAVIQNIHGAPDVPIQAFLAPYSCKKCDVSSNETIQTSSLPSPDAVDTEFEAPARACPKCGSKMEFDGLEQEFSYLLHRRPQRG